MGLLEPVKYGEQFHKLYVNSFDKKTSSDRLTAKHRRKKTDKRKPTSKYNEQSLTSTISTIEQIELEPNASKFAVFSAVRSSVLESETKYSHLYGQQQDSNNIISGSGGIGNALKIHPAACCCHCAPACKSGALVDCRCHAAAATTVARLKSPDIDSDAETYISEDTTDKDVMLQIPQIVGAGLRGLFDLIAEARSVSPTLCTKALKALFDVIQGQIPESFKNEPTDLIDPLYDLLLDLTTLHGPASVHNNDTNNWSSIGCSALLGLCVARGDTGKTLKAIAALLMSPKILANQNVQLPLVLNTLQRSIYCVALGKPTKPDYYRNGIPKNSKILQFSLKNQLPANIQYHLQPSIASNGRYIFILTSKTLLKIGTGFNGTLRGYVYAVNNEFGKDKMGWIGFCGDILFYKKISKRNTESILIVNTETLNIISAAQITIPPTKDGQNCLLFSDGESLNAICTTNDDTLVVKQIYTKTGGNIISDLALKLARKSFKTLGYAAFEDEVLNQNQIQSIQTTNNPFEPKLPNDLDVLGIICGKEFGLVRGANGKVFYYGKSAALGLKSIGKTPSLKMTELIISKVSHIVQIVIGHDGIHAILLNDDGTVYFCGTARRGEDGDTSKNRRQPKAVKPKKLSKIDSHFIIHASCNNGTSAFVTKSGKLIMFGKDTAHCDSSGFVTDLLDQHITKVALGKAHCVALNTKGQIFTFGLNNKGQCGRGGGSGGSAKNKENISFNTVTQNETGSSGGGAGNHTSTDHTMRFKYDTSNICDLDEHNVVQGQCRVCSVCRECTGYNISCVSTQNTLIENRIPGANCACGHGDAGCLKCGACSTCISVQETENGSGNIGGSGALATDTKDNSTFNFLIRQRSKSLILRQKEKKIDESNVGSGNVGNIGGGSSGGIGLCEAERDTPRVAPLSPHKVILPTNSSVCEIACGMHHTVVLTLSGEVFTFGSNQYGQLGTGDLQPHFGPVPVKVSGLVCQIAAGSNHTVLLTTKGVVYTFGNHQKGQLGRLPNEIQRNSNSSEEIMHRSEYSGGSVGGDDSLSPNVSSILLQRQKYLWNCTPGAVFGIGPNFGKKATWISASGDQTFFKIDESLITGQMLSKINIVADKSTILLLPQFPLTFNCLAISRRDGNCNAHCLNQVNFAKIIQTNSSALAQLASDKCNQNVDVNAAFQQNQQQQQQQQQHQTTNTTDRMSQSVHEARNQIFEVQENSRYSPDHTRRKNKRTEHKSVERIQPQLAFALDVCYNVLWVFDAISKNITCYNVIASEMPIGNEYSSHLRAILSPELALPQKTEMQVTRNQASLNILACLDILTSGHDLIPSCFEQIRPRSISPTKDTQNSDFTIVSRFENLGGGWGYSGHSVEAIRFMADTDIFLCGFAMFGGRGEYTCKLKLYDLGADGGGYEKDGILISETDEVPYECPARSKYNIMLPKPLIANAGKWFLVWARISGPSSDCGSAGQSTVTTEDQIVFNFKTSKKANNGTDVNSGQIPSILYRIITQETKQPPICTDLDPVYRVSRLFANTVTKECFENLVLLLNWAWGTFKLTLNELKDKKKLPQTTAALNRLFYINKACLRLLRKYTNEIYPNSFFGRTTPIGFRPHSQMKKSDTEPKSSETQVYVLNQGPAIPSKTTAPATASTSAAAKGFMCNSMDATTPTNPKKVNAENLQLAECIGNVRALLIQILCDEIPSDIEFEGYETTTEILDECHTTFLSCFNAFYPTSTLKWNCLCDLLAQEDKGIYHPRLLSAIIAGLCNPNVKLLNTFSLLSSNRESKSIVSPSDNSGLPMLSSTENHQYPVLVEQMIYRTQQEKSDFLINSWHFKDVLVRLLEIISQPIRSKIENIYNRCNQYVTSSFNKQIYQKLVENCCHMLARVLSEIVYQSCSTDVDVNFLPSRSLHTTGSRFARCDVSRTWNTGNFGPDAISFSVNRPGIAIAGAMVYSGSGSYEYQLELLYDSIESQSQHKWETLESISGTYDQDVVHSDMAELKFERPVHIKDNARYAIRLCSQGSRTCSGDAGLPSTRGPCGTTFSWYPCDLSFNGTTPARGQIPSILYYSTPLKNETYTGKILNEIHARDTALQIAADITKKCTELLILARNTLAASMSPSEKSLNSSNNTQTIDSEQNITPIEEHFDVTFANNSNNTSTPVSVDRDRENCVNNVSTARDLTKRIESFSKGIMETLKFDKRSTNPFEYEIEIGATEIHPKDLLANNDHHNHQHHHHNQYHANLHHINHLHNNHTDHLQDHRNMKNGRMSKINGNNSNNIRNFLNDLTKSGSDDDSTIDLSISQILKLFEDRSASMFHKLLPLVFAHIGPLANSDPKSSVQILSLIRDILPHVSALNQIYCGRDHKVIDPSPLLPQSTTTAGIMRDSAKQRSTAAAAATIAASGTNFFAKDLEDAKQHILDLNTTSNHYCIVESDHPYKSATINTFRVEFPPCVQWFTVEFDHQCGTAQTEDYLLVTIPIQAKSVSISGANSDASQIQTSSMGDSAKSCSGGAAIMDNASNDRFTVCKNACITSCMSVRGDDDNMKMGNNKSRIISSSFDDERFIVKMFNTPSQWTQSSLVLPGNQIDFSLETASNYARDQQMNKYGFRCLIVGYENPSMIKMTNACLNRLEWELAYLGGMCSANLMKKDLILPGDNPSDDYTNVEETIATHAALLSKGLAISDSVLTINQALDSYLPVGGQSNERQFLKDFVTAAPGSSGARLAAWLQPEPRLDPNKCELKTIQEPVRFGWPTQLTVITRDQYGDTVYIPDLKIEIKATPSGGLINSSRKIKKVTPLDHSSYKGMTAPPKIPYEPTVKDKMCFKAVTFMKAYQQYSFEELRFCNPIQARVTETLIAHDMGDLTFGSLWTPNSIGSFCITVTIDGIALEEVYRVEVKEAGMPPPTQRSSLKKSQPQNKLRKFIAKNSAGLRIRSHPTLQSEQVGIVKMDGIISFIDENENDDGIWVRLSTESIRQHCTPGWYPPEAWCLQYNQHLGRTLLHPVIEHQSVITTTAVTSSAISVTSASFNDRLRQQSQSSSIDIHDTTAIENIDPSSATSIGSPSKKVFDFSSASKFTPPSGTIASAGSNPFIFTSTTPPISAFSRDSDITNPFDIKQLDSSVIDKYEDMIGGDGGAGSVDTFASAGKDDDEKRCPMQPQFSQCLRGSPNQSPTQSNIGTTIAGVVGSGASKLQSLHKWFKGDSFDGKDFSRKRNELSELASVSVRDLVKVIGGQDSKSNGNGATPPHHSRCSSPVAVPSSGRNMELLPNQSAHSSFSRSVEVSDSSVLISSLAKDPTQSHCSQSSFKEETLDTSPFTGLSETHGSHTEELPLTGGSSSRINNFSVSPKYSPRKARNKRAASPNCSSYSTTTHNASIVEPNHSDNNQQQSNFSQNDATSKASKRSQNFDFANDSDATAETPAQQQQQEKDDDRPVLSKRALPSSLAESLRAVFAAFLWHEGIVHDAMACSSFLKFHPSLPKDGALVVNEEEMVANKVSLSKEQRAQQRYSVEVANAGNYLNIRPSTLETLTKSGNSSIHNRRYRKNGGGDSTNCLKNEQIKLQSLPEMITVCPPALKCLLYLWEQLCSNCVEIVQSNASVPVSNPFSGNYDNNKDHSPPVQLSKTDDIVNSVVSAGIRINQDFKKSKKKKKDDGTWCELCEIFLTIPVTYHMRIVHPGCGKPAKGKGYNSVGTFCEGWAGNCGEGGKGASSWYLMCDQCRDKYTMKNLNINNINVATNNQTFPASNHLEALFGLKSDCVINSEIYTMLKDNSLFLLELSSTGTGGILTNQKRSPYQQMPVVSETQLHQIASDLNKPSTSRAGGGGDVNGSYGNRNSKIGSRDSFKGAPTTPYNRRSEIPACTSPELLWQAPDTFSCLESLGASMTNDSPYACFGLNFADNRSERPLSEVSLDSIDRSVYMPESTPNNPTNSLSRFHRSYSMGQGWPSQNLASKFNMTGNLGGTGTAGGDNVSNQNSSKVVLRRRNNSTCDDGSLLLCHPSDNLRKLVPDSVFHVSAKLKSGTADNEQPPKLNIPAAKDVNNKSTANDENIRNDFLFRRNENNFQRSKESTSAAAGNKSSTIITAEQNAACLLSRPTMIFIMEPHNLEKLRYSLKRSLRVATCRIYSLQALNWLMRSVTQTSCLHDLMWWFVTSLKSSSLSSSSSLPSSNIDDGKTEEFEQALEHPVSSTQMCGKISILLTQSFHNFLQTVADITLMLPPGSSLQQIAIQCFGIKFRQADHQFLHRSHVFGNISKILSRSDEQNEDMLLLSSAAMLESNSNVWGHPYAIGYPDTRISSLVDLNGMFEVTVSSRQAMAISLTDMSTETFWESDDEDRNKSKVIELSMNKLSYICKMIYVHIDNSRDIQNKVSNVIFYAGQSLGDTNLIKSVEIDPKSNTWISANVRDESFTHFRLEFRGPEGTLRVRQVKLLGIPVVPDEINYKQNPKSTNAFQIQQRNCETETLRVFRLITAQVFGKLILGSDQVNADNNINKTNSSAAAMEASTSSLLAESLDLREHMVGILFSRSKLSHLQKQVIVHIVHAIRKETQRAREEWEVLNSNAAYTINQTNIAGNFDEKSDSSSENSRAPDTYCFEMLSMVLALSGSTVGRSYLSHQHGLLKDLLSLLHTGSDRVQRQVTSLLRRILPEITAEHFAELLGVNRMPPNDFSIVANQTSAPFDMNRLGIIDIFLAVIAKSLQLQVKIKTVTATTQPQKPTNAVRLCNCIDLTIYQLKINEQQQRTSGGGVGSGASCDTDTTGTDDLTIPSFDFRNLNDCPGTTHHVGGQKNLNNLWFLKGTISMKQADNIISLIRDMASGKFSEKWSLVTKAAIAEAILNLTRLDEVFRSHENCIKTATLWLSLASLCVLDKDHVERLSSGQWSKSSETRPLCTNHDDGITPAVIQCETCASLCADCDRFLHLNRKTRQHHRTVCKEEEEAIRVELHESCGRTKLFWLLALADSKSLKAMVEFRDGMISGNNAIISGPSNSVGRCRFCGVTGNSGLLAIGNVCVDAQCQEHAANTCAKTKQCGHACGGVINETKCLPCLQLMCHENETTECREPKLTQDADDMCMICFEALSCAPAIQLDCGHVFHFHCCKTVLQKRWTGPRISFGFSQCPICKIDISHNLLNEVLEWIVSLKADVKRKAMMRLEYEGIIKTTDHKDLASYAMDRYAYYVCFKCQKAYYGGEARCDAELGDKYDPEELVCGGCSDVARAQMCPKHGTDFLEYKCRYCCSVAVFFCFGTTHFCDTCHDDFQRLTNIAKNKLPRCPAGPKAKQLLGEDCPLHVVHPPTGEEFALGCGICRNAQTF